MVGLSGFVRIKGEIKTNGRGDVTAVATETQRIIIWTDYTLINWTT